MQNFHSSKTTGKHILYLLLTSGCHNDEPTEETDE